MASVSAPVVREKGSLKILSIGREKKSPPNSQEAYSFQENLFQPTSSEGQEILERKTPSSHLTALDYLKKKDAMLHARADAERIRKVNTEYIKRSSATVRF